MARFLRINCIAAFFAPFLLSSCGDDHSCDSPYEKLDLVNVSHYVPYSGLDTITFLFNKSDTQYFVGQGIESYYITEIKDGQYHLCPIDHQCLKILFKNTKNADSIVYRYEWDKTMFAGRIGENFNTFYKFKFNNIDLNNNTNRTNEMFVTIAGTPYNYVEYFYGQDTSEYVAYRIFRDSNKRGILSVKTKDHFYELLP